MAKQLTRQEQIKKRKAWELYLGLFAVLSIVAAWIIGGMLQGSEVEPYLPQAYPTAARVDLSSDNGFYTAFDDDDQIIGYVAVGEQDGYGGPMEIAVGVDLEGNVVGTAVVSHKETASFYARIVQAGFFDQLPEKSYSDPFKVTTDIDAVTGATVTSAAVSDAVKRASSLVAEGKLGLAVEKEPDPEIVVGVPEITLIILFAIGFVNRKHWVKNFKLVRWATMLVGLVVLGFMYNMPLTISKINSFLMGYFPVWQTNIFWYVLIFGIIFVVTVDNRNSYCEVFCPFGAAQEVMGVIGGAKPRKSKKFGNSFKWVQRGLAWGAIFVALLMRNPGITSYEVFGGLFDLNATTFGFAILVITLISSLFIHRFWCRYLCPMKPVVELMRLLRKWIVDSWKKRTKRTA